MFCEPAGFPNKGSSKNPETRRHKLGMLKAVYKLTVLDSHGKGEGQRGWEYFCTQRVLLTFNSSDCLESLSKHRVLKLWHLGEKAEWSRVQGHPGLHKDLVLKK